MINVALIGTWHVHFEGYANTIKDDSRCLITCLWDPDEARGKKYAGQYGCEFVKDYNELLKRSDVDAVAVATSTDLHPEVMIKAAVAKKHIFTEKVLAITSADAERIENAVKDNKVKFCISFPWRARGDFLWIKDAVDNGLIGKLNYCRMRNAHNGTIAGWLPDTFYDKKSCGGGAMMDLGAHSMYILNWIMGKPVGASSAFTHVMVNSVEDNAVTVLTYEGGAIGVSETAFVAANNPFELEIVGDKGTILAGGVADKVCYNIGNGWVYPEVKANRKNPLAVWIDAIADNTDSTEIPYGIEDAVALTKTMEIAYNNIF